MERHGYVVLLVVHNVEVQLSRLLFPRSVVYLHDSYVTRRTPEGVTLLIKLPDATLFLSNANKHGRHVMSPHMKRGKKAI